MSKGARVIAMIELLEANAGIAEGASMTGALAGGKKALIDSYNQVLAVFRRDGMVDELMFKDASEDCTMDDIGVYSRQLARYTRGLLGIHKRGNADPEEWRSMVETVIESFFGESGKTGEE